MAADGLGSKEIRPWANYISKRELKLVVDIRINPRLFNRTLLHN